MGISFEQFVEKVAVAMSAELGGGKKVTAIETQKNNGVLLHGIAVREDGERTACAIYLESFYRQYEQGKTFAAVIRELTALYESARRDGGFDVGKFTDFSRAGERIAYRLVNYGENRAFLEKVPHMRFLDLAVVFYYLLEEMEYGNALIQVRKEHLAGWDVGQEEVLRMAKENTPRLLPFEIRRMSDLVREMSERRIRGDLEQAADFGRCADKDIKERLVQDILKQMELTESDGKGGALYVLTNSRKNLGAACILYPGILRNFGEMVGRDFYVLPSSIHEVLLMPMQRDTDARRLKTMVREVNETEVEPQERLSDNVYYYDRSRGKLEIC